MKFLSIFFFVLVGTTNSATAQDFIRVSPEEIRELPTLQGAGTVRGCSASQAEVVRQVSEKISARTREAASDLPTMNLDYVKRAFIEPENRQYQEGAPVNERYTRYLGKAASVLSKMQTSVNEGVNFECKSDRTERYCRGGEVTAYVLASFSGRSYPMIYVCDGFFSRSLDEAVSTAFHELSHYSADTEDYGLDWISPTNPDLDRGANDAYHYEQFSLRATEPTLKRQIWYWLWPAQPE